MEEHIFVTVNGLRVKIKMSYHIIPVAKVETCGLFENRVYCNLWQTALFLG